MEEEFGEETLEESIDALFLTIDLDDPKQQEEVRADIKATDYDFDALCAAVYKAYWRLEGYHTGALGIVERRLEGTEANIDKGLIKISRAYKKIIRSYNN